MITRRFDDGTKPYTGPSNGVGGSGGATASSTASVLGGALSKAAGGAAATGGSIRRSYESVGWFDVRNRVRTETPIPLNGISQASTSTLLMSSQESSRLLRVVPESGDILDERDL